MNRFSTVARRSIAASTRQNSLASFSARPMIDRSLPGTGAVATEGFHTLSTFLFPSRAVPNEAVEKGARQPKDTNVGAQQSPHLPHHSANSGDKMPAVKNNASLPSKKGDASNQSGSKKFSTSTRVSASGERPTGTADTPGSRAVDPAKGVQSPSFAPGTERKADYTHIKGNAEPDSHRSSYQYSTSTDSGATPSGAAPKSSTTPETYPTHTTKGLPKDASGIGSSNKAVEDPLKGADEMVGQMKGTPEVGQAGDDVGGRAYTPPPDVGSNIEDTLPKPIKS